MQHIPHIALYKAAIRLIESWGIATKRYTTIDAYQQHIQAFSQGMGRESAPCRLTVVFCLYKGNVGIEIGHSITNIAWFLIK